MPNADINAQCKLILEYDEAGNRVYRGHGSTEAADLTITLTLIPTNINGPTTLFFRAQVSEIAGNCAVGDITVVTSDDSKFTFTYDPSLINYGPFSLNNPDWEHDATSYPGLHLYKNSQNLAAGATSSFGIEGVYDPQGTSGVTPFTFTIIVGSGGETNGNNNNDAERLIFQSN